MKSRIIIPLALAAAAFVLSSPAAFAQDAAAFAKCAQCHGMDNKNKVGPHLNGVVGRKAASLTDYQYSPALKKAGEGGLTWTEDKLDAWITDPKKLVPGTKMLFAGIKDAGQRQAVIAYLKTAGGGGAAAAPAAGAAPAPAAGAAAPVPAAGAAAPAPAAGAAAPAAPATPAPAAPKQ